MMEKNLARKLRLFWGKIVSQDQPDKTLFIGECAKKNAKEKCFLSGCPPTKEEMFEFLKGICNNRVYDNILQWLPEIRAILILLFHCFIQYPLQFFFIPDFMKLACHPRTNHIYGIRAMDVIGILVIALK